MFNDIFWEALWKFLTEIKPPGPWEMQAKRKGSFLIKCRLQRDLSFFLQCRISQFLVTHKKYQCLNYEMKRNLCTMLPTQDETIKILRTQS